MDFFCPEPTPPEVSTLAALLPNVDLTSIDGLSQLSATDVAKLALLASAPS